MTWRTSEWSASFHVKHQFWELWVLSLVGRPRPGGTSPLRSRRTYVRNLSQSRYAVRCQIGGADGVVSASEPTRIKDRQLRSVWAFGGPAGRAGSGPKARGRWGLLDQRMWPLRVVTQHQMSIVVDQRTRGAGQEGRLRQVDWRRAVQRGETECCAPPSPPRQTPASRPSSSDVRSSRAGTSLVSRMVGRLGHHQVGTGTTRGSNPTAMPTDRCRPPQTPLLRGVPDCCPAGSVAGTRFHVKHRAGAGREGRPNHRAGDRRSCDSGSRPVDARPRKATHVVRVAVEASALATTATSVDSSLGSPEPALLPNQARNGHGAIGPASPSWPGGRRTTGRNENARDSPGFEGEREPGHDRQVKVRHRPPLTRLVSLPR